MNRAAPQFVGQKPSLPDYFPVRGTISTRFQLRLHGKTIVLRRSRWSSLEYPTRPKSHLLSHSARSNCGRLGDGAKSGAQRQRTQSSGARSQRALVSHGRPAHVGANYAYSLNSKLRNSLPWTLVSLIEIAWLLQTTAKGSSFQKGQFSHQSSVFPTLEGSVVSFASAIEGWRPHPCQRASHSKMCFIAGGVRESACEEWKADSSLRIELKFCRYAIWKSCAPCFLTS